MVATWVFRILRRLVFAAVMVAPASTLAAEHAADVADLLGRVQAIAGETQRTLRLGDAVFEGERVVTAAGAKAKLLFVDRSVLTIGPSSELRIDRSLYRLGSDPKRESLFELTKGLVRALASRWSLGSNQRFEIRSPSAVAGVRGTEFIVAVGEDGKTEIHVLEGEVDVLNVRDRQNRGVRLTAGQFSLVTPDRLPSPARPSPGERLRALAKRLTIDAVETLDRPPPGPGNDEEGGEVQRPDGGPGSSYDGNDESGLGGGTNGDDRFGSDLDGGDNRDFELGTPLEQDVTPTRVRLGVDIGR